MRSSGLARSGLFALALGLCVVAGASAHEHEKGKAAAGAAAATPAPKTLQGELLDMNCYMAHEGKGEKHKKCADACISEGAPMGLLTQDGKVYLLVADHALKDAYEGLKERAAEQVKVTGEVYERGGVQALLVKSVEGGKTAEGAK